jgi:hypothetical protein
LYDAKDAEQEKQKERQQNTTFDILNNDGILYEIEQTVYNDRESRKNSSDDFRVTPRTCCRGE